MFRSFIGGVAAVFAVIMFAATALADTSTVRVAADGDGGWLFNADPLNVTPYGFTTAEASIGFGSVHIDPISNAVNGNADKFTASLALGTLVSDLDALSYDFLIAGGTSSDAKQFYLNIYTNYATPLNWYDCRFDYLPASGSTAAFTTVNIASGDAATAIGNKSGGCPTSLAAMPAGSTISAVVLNLGDTSASDTGVGGYYDNVVLTSLGGDVTVYDFEANPTTKKDCKKGGWEAFGFRNQGQCVSFFEHDDDDDESESGRGHHDEHGSDSHSNRGHHEDNDD